MCVVLVGSPIMSPTSMAPLSVPSVPSPDIYQTQHGGMSPCKTIININYKLLLSLLLLLF